MIHEIAFIIALVIVLLVPLTMFYYDMRDFIVELLGIMRKRDALKTRLLKKLRRQLDREITIGWDDEYYIVWREEGHSNVYYDASPDIFVGWEEDLTANLDTAKKFLRRAKLKAMEYKLKRYKIEKLTREANK